eukprot:07650_5
MEVCRKCEVKFFAMTRKSWTLRRIIIEACGGIAPSRSCTLETLLSSTISSSALPLRGAARVSVRRIWTGRAALPALLVSLFPGSAFAASFSAVTASAMPLRSSTLLIYTAALCLLLGGASIAPPPAEKYYYSESHHAL